LTPKASAASLAPGMTRAPRREVDAGDPDAAERGRGRAGGGGGEVVARPREVRTGATIFPTLEIVTPTLKSGGSRVVFTLENSKSASPWRRWRP
jgi:hypothetical protein